MHAFDHQKLLLDYFYCLQGLIIPLSFGQGLNMPLAWHLVRRGVSGHYPPRR